MLKSIFNPPQAGDAISWLANPLQYRIRLMPSTPRLSDHALQFIDLSLRAAEGPEL